MYYATHLRALSISLNSPFNGLTTTYYSQHISVICPIIVNVPFCLVHAIILYDLLHLHFQVKNQKTCLFVLCEFHYLSRLSWNAGLTENMFKGLQDLCSPQICSKLLYFLQSHIHGLLGILNTFTNITHSKNEKKKISIRPKFILSK